MNNFSHQIIGSELWAWRSQALRQARSTQIAPAELDWLLQNWCQLDTLALRLGTLATLPAVPARGSLADLQQLWQKRLRDRVPVQHLIGHTTWRNFTVQVSPAVLIPRPETELIIDIAITLVSQSSKAAGLQKGFWVDLGTGSGAIAMGLATVFPQATILAVDVSPAALAIAQQNALANGLGDRIQFLCGSWFAPLAPWRGHLAGIVSNPPYIPTATIPTLAPEVAHHDPHLALDGGKDGLVAVNHLIDQGADHLTDEGIWLVELMQHQAPEVIRQLAATHHYTSFQSHPDLAGIDRFVSAHKAGNASVR
jgi:release factor glutamine methyltransferase